MLLRYKRLAATAAALAAAAVLYVVCFSGSVLCLTDAETGKLYAYFPVTDGTFSISFKHSVNKSDVEEGYRIYKGCIYLEWCLYSAFGAGVADSAISVSFFNRI